MAADAVSDYLNRIGKIPMLADEEQLILGRLIQRWQRYEGGPDAAPPGIKRAGLRARERFVTANLRLVIPLVRKYRRAFEERGGTMMDLIQEGNIGLTRGVEKFNPELGYRASTYLYWWIRQGVCKATEAEGVIRISAHSMQVEARIRKTLQELGPGAKLVDACAVLKLDVSKTTEMLSQIHAARCTSLDQRMGEKDTPLSELIADPSQEVDYDQLDREEAIRALQDALPDDLAMVELSQATTHKELAVAIGCNTKQVVHHLSSAKERLRDHLSRPVEVKRDKVVVLDEHRPVTTSNGYAEVVALEAAMGAPAAEPAAEPAAPAKKRRVRRTKEQLAAAKAAQAPELITFSVNGIPVSAAPDAAAQLLKHLAA